MVHRLSSMVPTDAAVMDTSHRHGAGSSPMPTEPGRESMFVTVTVRSPPTIVDPSEWARNDESTEVRISAGGAPIDSASPPGGGEALAPEYVARMVTKTSANTAIGRDHVRGCLTNECLPAMAAAYGRPRGRQRDNPEAPE